MKADKYGALGKSVLNFGKYIIGHLVINKDSNLELKTTESLQVKEEFLNLGTYTELQAEADKDVVTESHYEASESFINYWLFLYKFTRASRVPKLRFGLLKIFKNAGIMWIVIGGEDCSSEPNEHFERQKWILDPDVSILAEEFVNNGEIMFRGHGDHVLLASLKLATGIFGCIINSGVITLAHAFLHIDYDVTGHGCIVLLDCATLVLANPGYFGGHQVIYMRRLMVHRASGPMESTLEILVNHQHRGYPEFDLRVDGFTKGNVIRFSEVMLMTKKYKDIFCFTSSETGYWGLIALTGLKFEDLLFDGTTLLTNLQHNVAAPPNCNFSFDKSATVNIALSSHSLDSDDGQKAAKRRKLSPLPRDSELE